MARNKSKRAKRIVAKRKEKRYKKGFIQDMAKQMKDNAKEVTTARLTAAKEKQLAEIYKIDEPEALRDVQDVMPMVPAMQEQLQQRGVPVNNQQDPVETITKYNRVVLNDSETVPDEIYNETFVDEVDEYETPESFENARREGRHFVGEAISTIVGGVKGLVNSLRRKKKSGEKLTKEETQILKGADTAAKGAIDGMRGGGQISMPMILFIIVALFLISR